MVDHKKAAMVDGKYDAMAQMKSEDYNGDGLLQWPEALNAMIRANVGEADYMQIEKFVKMHGDKDMTLTPDGYMKVVAEFDKLMKEKEAMKGGKGGKRMEIHMEEHPDGKAKITIMMSGAKSLALSAAAVVSAALFSY